MPSELTPSRAEACWLASSAHCFLPAAAIVSLLLFWVSQVGQKMLGGRAEFWKLWNTGSAWEVMCLGVNCTCRRMHFLHYFLSGAAPSRWLAFSRNADVFLHWGSYMLIAILRKKKQIFWKTGEQWQKPAWREDSELSVRLWGTGQVVVSPDPQIIWALLHGGDHIFCFCMQKCKEKPSMKERPRTFFFLKSLARRKTLTMQ